MEEIVYLTPKEAEDMLPDGDYIHTFRQAGYTLLGADWEREEVINAFKKFKPQLSGKQATAMKHGIVFEDAHGYVFVATDETKLSDNNRSDSEERKDE